MVGVGWVRVEGPERWAKEVYNGVPTYLVHTYMQESNGRMKLKPWIQQGKVRSRWGGDKMSGGVGVSYQR